MNLGQFYTKREVADFMVSLFTLEPEAKVLDPCFGKGVFIDSLLSNSSYLITGVEIESKSFNGYINPNSDRCNLINGDFFDVREKYDGIIMNPPYVRQEEIDDLSPLGINKQKLQSSCGFAIISPKANLYMYFILKSLSILNNGGELIAIFPNSWTHTRIGKEFSEQILHFGSIAEFINIEGNAFDGNPLVDVCIIKFIKGLTAATINKQVTIGKDSSIIEAIPTSTIKATNGLVKLCTIANIRRGITTGFNKIFINPPIITQNHLEEILSSPKYVTGYSTKTCILDKMLSIKSDDKLNDEELEYLNNCSKYILKEGKPKSLKSLIDKDKKWYITNIPATSQIIFSYIIRECMKFVLNDGDRQVRDNFYMINSKLDKYLLLSLLNNHHVYYQLECMGKSYGKGLLKLQKYDIDEIVIPQIGIISDEDKDKLIDCGKILVSNSDNSILDDITVILDKYYGIENAKEQFLFMKQKRLYSYE